MSYLYLRHRLPVRVMHWINVLSLTVLLMSGLMIFNAHPALNWGKSSYDGKPPVLEITTSQASPDKQIGVLRVFGHEFETTGLLGLSTGADGQPIERAFPPWMTIPGSYSLAEGRQWHFFFAWLLVLNGIAYVGYAFLSRHLRRVFPWPQHRKLVVEHSQVVVVGIFPHELQETGTAIRRTEVLRDASRGSTPSGTVGARSGNDSWRSLEDSRLAAMPNPLSTDVGHDDRRVM